MISSIISGISFLFKIVLISDKIVFPGQKALDILKHATVTYWVPHGANYTAIKNFDQDSIGPPSTRMPMTLSPVVTFVNVKEKLRNVMRCHKTLSKFVKSLTSGALIYGAVPVFHREQINTRGLFDYCQKGFKQRRSHQ
ncbi:hypothetical protein Tco_1368088 [Tanacetum coccineum]